MLPGPWCPCAHSFSISLACPFPSPLRLLLMALTCIFFSFQMTRSPGMLQQKPWLRRPSLSWDDSVFTPHPRLFPEEQTHISKHVPDGIIYVSPSHSNSACSKLNSWPFSTQKKKKSSPSIFLILVNGIIIHQDASSKPRILIWANTPPYPPRLINHHQWSIPSPK